MLATRQLPVPETLDVLLVEQEVVGSDLSALEVGKKVEEKGQGRGAGSWHKKRVDGGEEIE